MAVAIYKAAGSRGRFPRWGYLDKFYNTEFLPKALLGAVALHFAVMGVYVGYGALQDYLQGRKAAAGGPAKRRIKVLTAADLGVPPSLTQQQASAVKVQVKARPTVAIPKPVPDELAVEQTIATQEEISAYGGGSDTGSIFGSDSLVIDAGDLGLPSMDEYVAYEKAPELVNMNDPYYPELARDAGVEGTVLVRVLVGEDGFVKAMAIIQSVPMLDESAAAAAETAVFKPALQKDRPVAVWMVIPIDFRLHG